MAAIEIQSLSITGLGQLGPPRFAVHVSNMANRVRQSEHVTFCAIERHSFFIMSESSFAVMQIPLNLSQSGKRSRQLNSNPSRAADVDRLQIPDGIAKPMISSRLKALP